MPPEEVPLPTEEPIAADPFGAAPVGGGGVVVRSRRPVPVRRSSDIGGLLAVFMLLLAAAGGLGYYFLWQQQQDALKRLAEQAKREVEAAQPQATDVAVAQPAVTPTAPGKRRGKGAGAGEGEPAEGSGALGAVLGQDDSAPSSTATARPDAMDRPATPRPAATQAATAEPPMRQKPTPVPAEVAAPVVPAPTPSPPSAAASDPAAIEKALRAAYAAIRSGDFDASVQAIDSVESGDDEAIRDRLARWKRFTGYAKGFKELREKAYRAAANSEFELDDRIIIIIEIDEERIVYRDSGKQQRMRLEDLPPEIDRAIVEQWLGRDGRAANHLFLGASHLAKDRPSPADASREWRRAAAGGEADGRLLEPLVKDPVILDTE